MAQYVIVEICEIKGKNGMNMKKIIRILITKTAIVLMMRILGIIAVFVTIVMILLINNSVWLVYPIHNLFHSMQ